MQRDARKYLADMQRAAAFIAEFTADRSFAEYDADPLLRSAVERQFAVLGEALVQLARTEPEIAARVTDHRRIISFRNILVHAYADIDHPIVWDLIQRRLPVLADEIEALLFDG